MERVLYMQCDSGVSGDMVVGALLDAGASADGLKEALASLQLEGFSIRISKKNTGAFVGCDFDVLLQKEFENHDHDMTWLYGDLDENAHNHEHVHHHEHQHAHDHAHSNDHHHDHAHNHEHRNLEDVRHIINESGLTQDVKANAMKVFEVIAQAEAKAHGETPQTVHFHEVGAIDSIVDIVAVAWCLDDLGIDEVIVSPLTEGEGSVRCAHGVLPIPVPAVAAIVEEYGLVLRRAHRKGELVTPTGAAIVAAFGTRDELPEEYRIIATGLGCGKRAYNPPSSLRVTLMESMTDHTGHLGSLWKLQTEVDDCTGEALGFVLDRLYEEGALEAHFIPVFMKKGRPGYQIEVLCLEDRITPLEDVLFEDTTTIGVRRYPVDRTVLQREQAVVQTAYGPIRSKRVTLPSGSTRTYFEHEDVAQISRERGVPYQDVLMAARGA